MDATLTWIQNLPVFVSIAESPSVWGYPTVLMLHTVGLGWLVGLNMVVNLRMLGVGKRVPVAELEPLFPMMWWGFWLNLSTGVVLFCLDATHKAHQWIFWVKLLTIALALVVLSQERRYLFGGELRPLSGLLPPGCGRYGDAPVAAVGRRYAWVSSTLWVIATATGRLMAYVT